MRIKSVYFLCRKYLFFSLQKNDEDSMMKCIMVIIIFINAIIVAFHRNNKIDAYEGIHSMINLQAQFIIY